jgi:ATP adenylyltransferase
MKRLWAPWRMQYIEEPAPASPACFFCAAAERGADAAAHLCVARDESAVTLLNKYPYGHGHLLVAPVRHVAALEDLSDAEYGGLMTAVRSALGALRQAFAPEGMNVGMNLGRAAGAGVADHCHWHLLPRWNGDTNFMPVIGDVKVMSEHLQATLERVRAHYP